MTQISKTDGRTVTATLDDDRILIIERERYAPRKFEEFRITLTREDIAALAAKYPIKVGAAQ